jgi:HEPN domain-containing protein
MKKQAKEWMKFAKTDLQSTKNLIVDENLSTSAAFHVQQCVEKSLKALLELYNKKVPRVHDLIKIKNKLEEEVDTINIKIEEEIIDQINQVYIDTRYPADFGLLPEGNPSKEKIEKFIEEAESIYNQSEKIIEEYKDD